MFTMVLKRFVNNLVISVIESLKRDQFRCNQLNIRLHRQLYAALTGQFVQLLNGPTSSRALPSLRSSCRGL